MFIQFFSIPKIKMMSVDNDDLFCRWLVFRAPARYFILIQTIPRTRFKSDLNLDHRKETGSDNHHKRVPWSNSFIRILKLDMLRAWNITFPCKIGQYLNVHLTTFSSKSNEPCFGHSLCPYSSKLYHWILTPRI